MPNYWVQGSFSNPTSVPGLAAWWDGADISTMFQDSAGTTPVVSSLDPLGKWNDKSGNGLHMTQATAGLRPRYKTSVQNGKSGVNFADTTTWMQFTRTLGIQHMVVVCRRDGAYSTGAVLLRDAAGGNDKDNVVVKNVGDANGNFYCTGSAFYAGGGTFSGYTPWVTLSTGTTYLLEMTADEQNRGLQVNAGTSTSGANPYTLTFSQIASYHIATNGFAGDVMELMLFRKPLSSGVLALLRNYLNAKWAIY